MTATPSPIAVTGATGFVGGEVARLLSERGRTTRLLVRSPGRAPRLEGSSVVETAYENTEQSRLALRGAALLFMVSAAESPDRVAQHLSLIDAAEAAGVQHVVYLSFLGAAEDAVFTLARDHWATEQHLRASGMNYTILRDSSYLDFLPSLAAEGGIIRGPAGDGRVSAVARTDVAHSAAAVLEAPAAHRGRIYDITGPEAIGLDRVAEILTAHGGHPVSYLRETVEEAYESRASYGAPDWEVDAWVSTYTAIAAGELETVSTSVAELTGREPLSLERFLAEQTPAP